MTSYTCSGGGDTRSPPTVLRCRVWSPHGDAQDRTRLSCAPDAWRRRPSLLSERGPFPQTDSGHMMGWRGRSPTSQPMPKSDEAHSTSSVPPSPAAERDPTTLSAPPDCPIFFTDTLGLDREIHGFGWVWGAFGGVITVPWDDSICGPFPIIKKVRSPRFGRKHDFSSPPGRNATNTLLGGRPFCPSCHCGLELTQLSNTGRIKSDFRFLGPQKIKGLSSCTEDKNEGWTGPAVSSYKGLFGQQGWTLAWNEGEWELRPLFKLSTSRAWVGRGWGERGQPTKQAWKKIKVNNTFLTFENNTILLYPCYILCFNKHKIYLWENSKIYKVVLLGTSWSSEQTMPLFLLFYCENDRT